MLSSPARRLLIALAGAILAIASRPHVDVRTGLALLGAFLIGIAVGSAHD